MLQAIRDQLKGWVAVVIFSILIIPFAFWGINYYFEQSGGVVALEVNGEEVTLADFQRAYQDMRQQWQAASGAPLTEETEPLLKQRVTEDLIRVQLLQQAGDKAGLLVGDAEAWEVIRQIPVFNDDNGFNMMRFEVAASQSGLTPAGFMGRIKQDMAVEQLRTALLATDFVTQPEVAGYAGLLHQTRDFSYTVLSSDELKETVTVTDEQIQAYYEQEGRYLEPERVRIAYLVLSAAKVAEEVYLEEGELETWFAENRQNYEVEETRKVRQILVKLPEEPTDELRAQMQAKANELYARVRAGEDWESIVVNQSGVYENAVEFSEFGFLSKGVMEAEVEQVVFAMDSGAISEPITSPLGFHIMAVDEIQGGAQADLDNLRDEVEQDLRQEKAEQQLYELTDRLSDLTFANPDTLEVAAEELGLAIQTSDYLTRTDPGAGIVSEPGVIAAAFSDEVLLEESNSELIELDNNRYIVLRLLERLSSFKKPLAEVRAEIITRLKFEQARDQTRTQGETLLERLQQGESKDDLALEFALNWNSAQAVTQDDDSVNRAVLRTAFRAGVPDASGPVYEGASMGTGDYAVVIVHTVTPADPDTLEEEQSDAVRAQLLQAQVTAAWEAYNDNLKAAADITVFRELL